MYKAFAELTMQFKKLEKTVAKQHAIINKQRSKVNLIDWLNEQKTVPKYKFREMITNTLVISDDIEYLFEHTYLNTLLFVLEREFKSGSDVMLPIVAFSQKQQLYIYDIPDDASADQSCVGWRCIELVEFKKLINSIQTKLIVALTEWKTNRSKITAQIEQAYNKHILKIMSTEFTSRTLKVLMSKTYNILKISHEDIASINEI
jgi:hypothetical protein